ncbi:hypothetical protein THAOC_27170 [Thalassiosira oceanica]|uniref:Uncharacterized protein n=1 Tax=Thalassiosira oceanica TaxID=159749 RepID=K0RJK5_THAOC|nr:hypothetical protein THAOC_27170 [Thalassiosira oceanica]|eukprot:EJK53405.1 hypothetical protein THAOC_27170 [Thalassiosira oceanica]
MVLGGMCKRHHGERGGGAGSEGRGKGGRGATHERGLSIFQEPVVWTPSWAATAEEEEEEEEEEGTAKQALRLPT